MNEQEQTVASAVEQVGDPFEKFKRHVNKPIPFKLTNELGEEDLFEFRPLSMEQFTVFTSITERIDKDAVARGETPKMCAEDIDAMNKLLVDVVMKSYPNLDAPVAENFVITNYPSMVDIINKLIPRKITESQSKTIQKRIEQLRNSKVAK